MMMKTLRKSAKWMTLALPLVALTACGASEEEVQQNRMSATAAQSEAQTALERADDAMKAAQTAQRIGQEARSEAAQARSDAAQSAREDARTASAKADRIFQQGLRK